MKKTINVNLKEHSYNIHIGQDILTSIGSLMAAEDLPKKTAIITDPVVNRLYGKQLVESLNSQGYETVVIEVPEGERSKNLKEAERLYGELLDNGLDRTSCIIALGGGVVGDLAGYVAGTYMRGIPLVQVPTTLLAQVDSAIGGKVGVDLPRGKNLVGLFHQPKLVVSDIKTLSSLPKNEFTSGLGEVLKYGIISDPELFDTLEKNIDGIKKGDVNVLTSVIAKCSEIKARIVEEDEMEHGRRIILNYGHTLGHALETVTGYSEYGHGEAVAIGMIFAAKLSKKMRILEEEEERRIVDLIRAMGLPTTISNTVSSNEILAAMRSDKKARKGDLVFVLLQAIGKTTVKKGIIPALLMETLEEMRE